MTNFLMGRHSLIGPSRRAVPFAGLGLTEFTARRVLVGWSCLIAAVVAGGAAACGPTNDGPDPITSGHAVVAELSNTTIGSPKTTPTTYWIVQRNALTACPDFLYFVRRYSARRPQFEHVLVMDSLNVDVKTQLRQGRLHLVTRSTDVPLPPGGMIVVLHRPEAEVHTKVGYVSIADATIHPDLVSDELTQLFGES